MNKFLKKMIFFSLVLIFILILMNYWMDFEPDPQYPLQYDEVFHPKVKADLVILGTSQATHGINPRYLEAEHLKVYNFAFSGAPPAFYLNWYRKVFRCYYPKPTYVIYAVHWVMFEDKLIPRRLEFDSRYFPFPFFIRQLTDFGSFQTLLLNRFAFIKRRKDLLYSLFHKRIETYPRTKYYKGFIPFKERKKLQKTLIVNPQIDAIQWRAFEDLLDDFEKDGIKVIFVHMPGYLYARDDQNIFKNVEQLKELAKKRGIPFMDYEMERVTSINTNPDLYADWIHMNEQGSEAFTKLLKTDLEVLLKK